MNDIKDLIIDEICPFVSHDSDRKTLSYRRETLGRPRFPHRLSCWLTDTEEAFTGALLREDACVFKVLL